MSTRRFLLALLLVFAGLLTVAACGGDDDEAGNDDEEETTTTEEEEEEDEEEAEAVDVLDLEEGDCIEDIGQLEEAAAEVDVIDCDADHDAEVFAVFDLEGDEGEPFPGDDVVGEGAEEGCTDEFEDYVGSEPDDSELDFNFILPNEETWEDPELQDREVVCVTFRADGDELDESIEDSEL
ncbi:MAG: septum formation family protein [Acidimicrobiales bacterium]